MNGLFYPNLENNIAICWRKYPWLCHDASAERGKGENAGPNAAAGSEPADCYRMEQLFLFFKWDAA